MTIRQHNLGSIVKPGFNPLGAQTSTLLYNLFSWGNNSYGQLGLGDATNRSSPNAIGSLTTWLNLACGYAHTIIKTDGTLWTWGRNTEGQLGLGNTTSRSSPVQVGALTAWLNIAGGRYHTVATKTDGTLWTWGKNNT